MSTTTCTRRARPLWIHLFLKEQKIRWHSDYPNSVTLVLPKGAGKDLQASVSLVDPMIAPLSLGDKLGVLSVSLAGEQIVSRPLVALEQVAVGSLWQRLSDTARLWFY